MRVVSIKSGFSDLSADASYRHDVSSRVRLALLPGLFRRQLETRLEVPRRVSLETCSVVETSFRWCRGAEIGFAPVEEEYGEERPRRK